MGGGGALGGEGPSVAQPPRLTGVLRALITDHGAAFDADQAFLRRQQALRAREQQQHRPQHPQKQQQLAGAGHSLQLRLLGPKAPKAARDDYEAFVAAIRALVGGDPPSAELAELAAAAWGAVGAGSGLARGGLEAPEGLKLHRPGLLQDRQLAPYAAALRAALQHVEPGAVARAVEAAGKLRARRAQLGLPDDDRDGPAAGGGAVGADEKGWGGKSQQAQPQLMAREWGADLQFVSPDKGPGGGGAHAYISRICGAGAADGPAAVTAAGARPAAPGAALATPGELLELYAAGMGGSRPAVEAAAAAGEVDGDAAFAAALAAEEAGGGGGGYGGYGTYGAAGGADEEVDIGSDDDERRKGRKAGVLWLERWCKSVGGPDEVDNLGTAVATLLLSDAAAAAPGGGEDELAAQLVDLLGVAGLDAVQQLMERRRELVESLREGLAKLRASGAAGEDGEGAAGSNAPSIVTGVTITSESQKLIKRMERKAARRGARGGTAGNASADADLELLSALGFIALVEQERPPREAGLTLGGVTFSIGDVGAGVTKSALPKGTTRA